MEEIICTYDHNTKSLTFDSIGQQSRIGDYINRWNAPSNSNKPSIEGDSPFELRIVYHSCRDLYNGNKKYWFNQEYYEQDPLKIQHKIPTIHLTMFCVFEKQNDRGKVEGIISNLVQRYKKVIDGSIWNYHVPIEINNSEFDYQHFNLALCEIAYHYNHKHYDLHVSLEYADLNARLVKQSFLIGNHKAVSPFLFHSENEMLVSIKSYDKELIRIRSHHWRFLLLDDKSIEPLSSINPEDGQSCNKLQIVSDTLCHNLGFDENKIWVRADYHEIAEDNQGSPKKEFGIYGRVIDGKWENGEFKIPYKDPDKLEDFQIVIDCVKNIKEAKICLKNYCYEIILLDYLLDEDGNRKQEYGYQFLKDLWDWNKTKQKKTYVDEKGKFIIGPNNCLTVMFISAFTSAVHERILEMGLGRSEKGLWYIGNGACPTNTPYLFSHLLLQLMRHRIEDLSRETEGGVFSAIDLLDQIYLNPERKGLLDVREYAHQYFNSLLFMREKYKRLEKDLEKNDEKELKESPNNAKKVMDMKSSLLVWSAFKVVHHFSGAFFDHLQHLVYLTAFGTVRQWQEMWEEYVFVHKELCEYDRIVVEKDNQGKVIKRGSRISDAIHSYIIKLKENSN